MGRQSLPDKVLDARLKLVNHVVRPFLLTGKMHGAGVAHESGSSIISEEDIIWFASQGADIVLIPASVTILGMGQQRVTSLIDTAHANGVLTMTPIGTSRSVYLLSREFIENIFFIYGGVDRKTAYYISFYTQLVYRVKAS